MVSNSMNKLHQTTYKEIFSALYFLPMNINHLAAMTEPYIQVFYFSISLFTPPFSTVPFALALSPSLRNESPPTYDGRIPCPACAQGLEPSGCFVELSIFNLSLTFHKWPPNLSVLRPKSRRNQVWRVEVSLLRRFLSF